MGKIKVKAVNDIDPALVVKTKVNRTREGDIVASVQCDDYDSEKVYRAVLKGLADIGFRIVPKSRVLLKPNILAQNKPDQAATTHPAIVGAVCRIFAENSCRVTVGESSAFYQGGGTRLGFETSGIAAAAKKYGAAILPFEATKLRKITSGKELNPFYVTEAVFGHDLIVNLPKMKLHRLARFTGAIKNCYGFIPGGAKQVYHRQFQERSDYQVFWGKPLVDVYGAVNPGLTVMDAVVSLDRDGPAANGEPRHTGLILVSENGAALDVTACRVMGFDPEWVPAVCEAMDRGLASPGRITVKGPLPVFDFVKLPDNEVKTGASKKIDDFVFDQFIVEPRLSESKCTKCDECVRGCAVNAISMNGMGYPVFDYSKCIFCYCCEEYCRSKAISLHGGFINHVIRGVRVIKGI